MRILLVLLLLLSAPSWAQDVSVLSWAEGDLDGDRVAERILIVSPDSPNPTDVKSRKELRILKRKGDRYVQVYKMPIQAAFSQKVSAWQYEEPGTKLWGLNYEPAAGGRKAAVMVCFTPSSGEYFRLVFDGKTYRVQPSGD